MSQIEAAQQRLDQAVSRLETAIRSMQAGSAGEHGRLIQQLAAMRSEYDMVKQTAATVSTRLDTAIGKLQIVLED
ncbi:MAG: hypothetical protein ACTSX7_16875 [Alphaproteobacteria bacterium]